MSCEFLPPVEALPLPRPLYSIQYCATTQLGDDDRRLALHMSIRGGSHEEVSR
jgi:hypothetical protein